MVDLLGLMTLKEVDQDEMIIEYGEMGEEFFLILDGEVEILVPGKYMEDYQAISFRINSIVSNLKNYHAEVLNDDLTKMDMEE